MAQTKRKVKIFTDSCSDLPKELRDKYDIEYLRMKITRDSTGEESDASLDWEKYSFKEYFDLMRGGEHFTTAQVPFDEFETKFTKYLDEGCDIVYIGCSLALSQSVNAGKLKAKELMEKYEGSTIECIDSHLAVIGEGLLAIRAKEYADEGLSAKEIAEKMTPEFCNTMNQFCAINNLTYLKRAGRVKASKAFFGNLFGVKPILISDARGMNAAVDKAKGRQASLQRIVQMLKESIIEPEKQTVYFVHADCKQEEIDYVVELVKKEIPCKDVYVSFIGPIIGATTGPETVALYAYGKEVTFIEG